MKSLKRTRTKVKKAPKNGNGHAKAAETPEPTRIGVPMTEHPTTAQGNALHICDQFAEVVVWITAKSGDRLDDFMPHLQVLSNGVTYLRGLISIAGIGTVNEKGGAQ